MSAVPGSPKAPLDRSSTKFEEHKEPPTNKTLTQSHTEPQLAYSFLQGGPQVSYPFVYTNVDSPKMPHKVGLRNELNTEGYQSHKNLLVVYVKFTESWIESICIEDAKRMTCGELKHEVIRLYGQGLHARSQEDGLPVRKKVIVNLKTIRNMRGLDMWLSQPERPLDKLKSGDVLEPLFARKPTPHPPSRLPLQQRRRPGLRARFRNPQVHRKRRIRQSLPRYPPSHSPSVRRKETGLVYAMKVIEKARIIRTKKIPQAFQELSIMSRLNSPFLVKIYYAFQSVGRAAHPLSSTTCTW